MTITRPRRGGERAEYTTYKDTGCEVSSSCLRCPLPMCKYDTPREGYAMRPETIIRRSRIVQLHKLGYDALYIAALERISRRSVYVAIRAAVEAEGAVA